MASHAEFATIAFGLASAVAYGMGDFSAGYASRRTPVLVVLLISQFIGLISLLILAVLRNESHLTTSDLLYGSISGIAGVIGLFGLYRGLAIGQMSIVAPITALLATGLPVIFSAATQGLPSALQMAGFMLALPGVWFLSRPQETNAPQKPSAIALLLAFIGGTGFGVFYILLAQVHKDVVFLPLAAARFTSVSLMLILLFVQRGFQRPTRQMLPIICLAGLMDSAGNALFLLSVQSGRLDIASVLASLYPVTTVLLALLLLKEHLSRWQLLGIVMVLMALPLIA
jgi:drug/metabolite transporter (DMT)-like permease